ncbi:type II secretion system F family protein [Gorillibacterium sp. sgz5001074]|uniref:type II secretion system F family protein n=1 Tax=Gorillibacterium sp. sgz5001074 TaxID=3446695 RepID=UPI003F663B8B
MPNYAYEAVNETGKKLKGVYNSASKSQAISELRAKGYMIRSISEKADTLMDKQISIGRAVKLEDFVIFCRQFATLIRSGIQIDQAVGILEDQTVSKSLKKALNDVHSQVLNGHQLSKAMGEHQRVFPDMFVNMVESAEAGGNMDEVLERMADHYEKEHKTIQKVKSAMTYPIIIIIIAIAVVIFLLIKIVPTFANMFQEQGAELPWITQFVMKASDIVTSYWWVFLLVVIGSGLAYKIVFSRDEQVQFLIDKAKFKIPVFGIVLKKAAIARLTRTMSSLFVSAVPVLQALEVTEKVVGNRVLAKVLRDARDSLSQGKPLSEPFTTSGHFPKLVLQMLYIGEETGQVDKMLMKIADFYEADVEQSVDRLKAVIEPLMLLMVSSVVGIIVAAIMSPMFKMYETFLK